MQTDLYTWGALVSAMLEGRAVPGELDLDSLELQVLYQHLTDAWLTIDRIRKSKGVPA
jgi:hypothetical protein